MIRTQTTFRRLLATAVLACTAPLAAAAGPTLQQVCHTASIPLQSTNWNNALTVPKFDPALGQLVSISFTLNGHIEGAARAESLDASPTVVTTNFQAQITLTRPDNSVIVVTIPIANFNDTFTAFDGVIDFGGTSGAAHLGISANASNSAVSPPPISDLALFTGLPNAPGTITLPVLAAGTSNASGSGNVITQFTTSASASCTVCYNYINTPPNFTQCNTNAMASVGVPFSTTICAADIDPNDTVTLTVANLPPGATLTPPLPASGNPICTTMNWTPGPADAGNYTITFTATDNHGNASQCVVNLLAAECHQLFGLQTGTGQFNVFGHLYDTHLAALQSAFPVTRESIPDFRVPHPHVLPNGLVLEPLPFYVQVVMYNPVMFPQNPSQWSKAMRVQVDANSNLLTSYWGTSNGIGVRAQTFTNAQGHLRMRFPFSIVGMP